MFNLNHLRSALVAYYFARSKGATFILFLDNIKDQAEHEDFKEAYVNVYQQCMNWDEGYENQFGEEGPYGPYESSKKFERYKSIAEQLVKEGKAYKCFCSKELNVIQNNLTYKNNKIPVYEGTCRNLSEQEIEKKLSEGCSYSIRLRTEVSKDLYKKVPQKEQVQPSPFIYQAFLQDPVIFKSSGLPSKFFTFAIDDIDQKITHVVRQIDWMRDVPKQELIYKALNYDQIPEFYHLPHMFDSTNRFFKNEELFKFYKISDMMKQGYTLQALANYSITQIWRKQVVEDKIEEMKKTTKNLDLIYSCEIYTPEYLLNNFSMEDVRPMSFPYDQMKLNAFNRYYIRQKYLPLFEEDVDQKLSNKLIAEFRQHLVDNLGPQFSEAIKNTKDKHIVQIIEIVTNRIRTLRDLSSYPFFFMDPTYDTKREKVSSEMIFKNPAVNKKYGQIIKDMINIFNKKVPESSFNDSTINKYFVDYIQNVNKKMDANTQFAFLKFTFTGYHQSHSIGFVTSIIGKQATLRRLRNMAKYLESVPQSTD